MGVISLVRDVAKAVRTALRTRYRPRTRLRLIYDYVTLRVRNMLAHRLGRPPRDQRLLGYTIRYLDPSFFHTNVHEVFLEEDYFFTCDEPDPVIVDCGSNIGLTVLYFKHRYPGARVLAFEPQPRVYATLRHNVEANGLTDVTLFNAALTGTDKTSLTLYHAPATLGDMRATTVAGVAGTRAAPLEAVEVRAVRLSTVLPERVDLLKIDVEGAEVEVLRELGGALGRVRQLFLEVHCDSGSKERTLSQVFDLLEGAGFRCLVHSSLAPPLHDHRGSYYTLLVLAYRGTNST